MRPMKFEGKIFMFRKRKVLFHLIDLMKDFQNMFRGLGIFKNLFHFAHSHFEYNDFYK